MTLSDPLPVGSQRGHGDVDSDVTGPGPQNIGIRESYFEVVPVLRSVGVPLGLRERKVKLTYNILNVFAIKHHKNELMDTC